MSPRNSGSTTPAAGAALGHPLAAAAGIHPISIPTPFPVGPVTAWLLEAGPLTLIDTGPASAEALTVVERQLAARGHRIEDLEAVALTHEHPDHLGLASILVERSGAEVVTIDALVGRLADPSGYGDRETAFMSASMVRHGVAREMAVALSGMQRTHRAWAGGPVTVTRAVASGERVELGGCVFELLLRPGHSVTDTLFVDHEHGIVIGGDHLLSAVSSNPLLACDPARLAPDQAEPPTPEDRVAALRHYVAGMRATAELAPAVVLGGHGPAVTNAAELVAERLRMHERRKAKILGLLDGPAPSSAFEIALRMWGDTAWKQPLLCISEVLGHLDLLDDDGAVRAERDGDVERWAPA